MEPASRISSTVLLIGGAVVLGVISGALPLAGLVIAVVAAYLGLGAVLPRSAFPLLTLGLLLFVPLDSVSPFDADLRAVPQVGLVLIGTLAGVLVARSGVWKSLKHGWDVALLAMAVGLTMLVNWSSGGVRQFSVLMAGVVFYAWVRMVGEDPSEQRHAFMVVTAAVGGLQGFGALIERVAGRNLFVSLVPGYAPASKLFAYELGGRAVALAGHPLRLGTMCMIGVLASVALLRSAVSPLRRRLSVLALAGSTAGLLLSGARGAWLGVVVGFVVLILSSSVRHSFRLAVGLILGVVVLYLVAAQTGLLDLVQERLFGAAYRPASLAQRVNILTTAGSIWLRRPILGWGFGEYLDQVYAQGFRYSNTENEYVNALLATGLLGFVALMVTTIRTFVLLVLGRRMNRVPELAAVFAALAVNIGTYNTFSWSSAFCLFTAVVALSHGVRDESFGARGELAEQGWRRTSSCAACE